MFFISISEVAKKTLESIKDNILKNQLVKGINSLKDYPSNKGKIIGKSKSGILYWEKRFIKSGYRVYYTIIPGQITIEKIEYEGTTFIDIIGNKKTQKKDIKKLTGD